MRDTWAMRYATRRARIGATPPRGRAPPSHQARFVNDYRNTGRHANVEFRLRRDARGEMRQGNMSRRHHFRSPAQRALPAGVYVCAKHGVRRSEELLISYGKVRGHMCPALGGGARTGHHSHLLWRRALQAYWRSRFDGRRRARTRAHAHAAADRHIVRLGSLEDFIVRYPS